MFAAASQRSGLRAVRADCRRFAVRDAEGCAAAIADALAHPHIDQEQQTPALEHLAGMTFDAIGKFHIIVLMALHDVLGVKRFRE